MEEDKVVMMVMKEGGGGNWESALHIFPMYFMASSSQETRHILCHAALGDQKKNKIG